MKVAQIKSAPQFESRDWKQYGIQTYGDTNDFPQTVSEIVQASKTGNACLSIYNDFVYGHGFKDPGIYKLRVNKEGRSSTRSSAWYAKTSRYGMGSPSILTTM